MNCQGINLRTGLVCSSKGKHAWRGKVYCVSHFAVAAREPGRFQMAVERDVRREAKERIRRQERSRQIDAFPDPELHPAPEEHVDTGVYMEDSCGSCGARYDIESGHSCEM